MLSELNWMEWNRKLKLIASIIPSALCPALHRIVTLGKWRRAGTDERAKREERVFSGYEVPKGLKSMEGNSMQASRLRESYLPTSLCYARREIPSSSCRFLFPLLTQQHDSILTNSIWCCWQFRNKMKRQMDITVNLIQAYRIVSYRSEPFICFFMLRYDEERKKEQDDCSHMFLWVQLSFLRE